MALSIAILGLPNVGKSTLFNALTDANALAANYPFATIEPNTGVVPIPDARLQRLADIYSTQKIVPATVTFVDIAGLVAGASQGEGLGNQFLAHIRSCNAICHLVRAFNDPNVQHVNQAPNPKRDIEIINTELVLADLQTVNRRQEHLVKEAKVNPKLKPNLDALTSAQQILDSGKMLSSQSDDWQSAREDYLHDLQLLSLKPAIYVFNVDEETLQNPRSQKELAALVAPARALFICAKIESELRSLDAADRAELLRSYGQKESGLIQLTQEAYSILGLQSFLTAGEKEVRAWTIAKNATAPQAAGVIHSDFERGFIAAQVVDYNDLVAAGSLAAARGAGKVRTEGKDYIVQPNDVIEFRFNT